MTPVTRYLRLSLAVDDDGNVTVSGSGNLGPLLLEQPAAGQDAPDDETAAVTETATDTDETTAATDTAGDDTAAPFEGGQTPDGPPAQV